MIVGLVVLVLFLALLAVPAHKGKPRVVTHDARPHDPRRIPRH